MPHCIVEYSQNLAQEVAPEDWLLAVQEACVASNLFQPEDIKLRAIPYKSYIMGREDQDAFVHVSVHLLSGRPIEKREALAEAVLKSICRHKLQKVNFSVDIVEMERASYRFHTFNA